VQLRLTLYTVILLTFTQGALLQFGLWGKQLFPPSLDLIVSTDCRSDICYGYVSSENAKRMVLDMPIQMSVSTKLFRPEDSSQAGEVFVQAQLQIEPVLPGAGPVTLTSDGEVTVRLTNITFKCEAKRLRNQYVAPQNATGSTMVHYPGGTVDARINVNVSGWLFPLFRGHGVNCTVDNAPTT
jgi:hypothetical protein